MAVRGPSRAGRPAATVAPLSNRHRVDLAKVETQQQNGLRPFFSALETFFFAVLSASNLKKWINSKKLQPLPTQD